MITSPKSIIVPNGVYSIKIIAVGGGGGGVNGMWPILCNFSGSTGGSGAYVEAKIPVFPGAFSPTEIYTAWSLGASMVKVFPISQLGPGYIQSIKAPFPQIKLMPTGGVGLEDIKSYKEAGASAFGIGSPMFPSSLIKTLNETDIFNYFKSFREKWEQC
jgi:2-keto-3-deoxy-6-phosphogluconate aldolase